MQILETIIAHLKEKIYHKIKDLEALLSQVIQLITKQILVQVLL
jgi:hypothetical protein